MAGPRLRRPVGLSADRARRLDSFELRRGQPLPLFEALAHSETALEDLAAGTQASIERTILPMRLREILILRTLAQWGARAEWDVHVVLYAPVAPLTQTEVEALGNVTKPVVWSAREAVLIDVADNMRRDAGISANLWEAVAHLFTGAECAEILMVATQYVKVALMTNALALPSLNAAGPGISKTENR